MKNLLFLFSLLILSTGCSLVFSEYPAEDCSMQYSFNGVDYLQASIEEYSGLEGSNLRILVNFDDGGFISITANDWEEETGTFPCNFWISDIEGDSYYESGTITVDVLESNHWKGSFVDENNFITNSSFTLRYHTL